VRGTIGYVVVFAAAAILLQALTPFPVLSWLGALVKTVFG
jgi:hypothetical protein